ncbi:hypothetical protein D9619_011096 [Psilocybe cf. subviscida]|uniref:Uncharacterized protein n=1 Tax=Psilocybe cf. subviscida TaxID=2480587 RepID=A0A8H5BK32_9AGAR|nr:hypothetical protein D9619_011096 [Psilocybe cf. subviscida]
MIISVSVAGVKKANDVLAYGRGEPVLVTAGEPNFRAMRLSYSRRGDDIDIERRFAVQKAISPRPPPHGWSTSTMLDTYMMLLTLLRRYAACYSVDLSLKFRARSHLINISLILAPARDLNPAGIGNMYG